MTSTIISSSPPRAPYSLFVLRNENNELQCRIAELQQSLLDFEYAARVNLERAEAAEKRARKAEKALRKSLSPRKQPPPNHVTPPPAPAPAPARTRVVVVRDESQDGEMRLLREQLQEAQTLVQTTEDALKAANARIKVVEERRSQSELRIGELQKQILAVEEEARVEREQLQQRCDEEIAALREEVAEAEEKAEREERARLETEAAWKSKAKSFISSSQVQAAADASAREIQDLHDQLEEAKQAANLADNRAEESQAELDRLRDEHDAIHEQQEELRTRVTALTTEAEKLRATAREATDRAESLAATLAQRDADLLPLRRGAERLIRLAVVTSARSLLSIGLRMGKVHLKSNKLAERFVCLSADGERLMWGKARNTRGKREDFHGVTLASVQSCIVGFGARQTADVIRAQIPAECVVCVTASQRCCTFVADSHDRAVEFVFLLAHLLPQDVTVRTLSALGTKITSQLTEMHSSAARAPPSSPSSFSPAGAAASPRRR